MCSRSASPSGIRARLVLCCPIWSMATYMASLFKGGKVKGTKRSSRDNGPTAQNQGVLALSSAHGSPSERGNTVGMAVVVVGQERD